MSETNPAPGMTEPGNPSVSYERKDANVRAIVLCAVGLVVVSVLVTLLVKVFFADMTARVPVQSALTQDRLRLPRDLKKLPEPRLQVDQNTELKDLRREEDQLLDNEKRPATWVVKDKVVSIPVTDAMELLSNPQTAKALGIRVRPVGGAPGQPGKQKGGGEK